MYKIFYTKKFRDNLKSINDFISQNNTVYGLKTAKSIMKTISLLKEFPYIWKKVEADIRELVDVKYLYKIVYRVKKDSISVLWVYKYKNSWE